MKTKMILILLLISFAGLYAQQKAKLQKVDETGFIEVDKAPELISKMNPEYPKLAKLAGIEGTVYLKLLIDEKGNVVKAKVEKGVKDMLDEAALKAVKKAKFSPAILKDKPIKVWVVLPIAFKLSFNENEPKIVSPGIQAPSNISDEEPNPDAKVEYEKGPEPIEFAKPAYPEEAKKNNITGKVFVKVLIDKEGTPKKAMVIESDNDIFNQSAMDAIMKSKFTAAVNKGEKIPVWVVVPYKFTLEGEKKK
ncbi:MAG: energy transducer TonB [Ignavibacteriales bacterium]|nr:energy transducer TonB [Ignavibacteriales bacterium]